MTPNPPQEFAPSDYQAALDAICAQTPENVSKPDVISEIDILDKLSGLRREEIDWISKSRDLLMQWKSSIRAQAIDETLERCAMVCDDNAGYRARQEDDARMFESVILRDKIRALKTGGSHD